VLEYKPPRVPDTLKIGVMMYAELDRRYFQDSIERLEMAIAYLKKVKK
jgi:hypothetical protein